MTARSLIARGLRIGADKALDIARERGEMARLDQRHEPSALAVAFFAGVVHMVADLVDPSPTPPHFDAEPITSADDLDDVDDEPTPAPGTPLGGPYRETFRGPTPPTREEASARVGHHEHGSTDPLGAGDRTGRSIDADITTLCREHGVAVATWVDPDGRAVHWRIERGDRFVTRMISERDLCERPDPHAYAMELMREDLAEIEGGLN